MICKASKRDGTPCTLPALDNDVYCWVHSKKTAEARRAGQSKGGRGYKASTDIGRLTKKLEQISDQVLKGQVNRSNAAVAIQGLGAAIKGCEALLKARELEEARLVETGLKVREQEILAEKVAQLEEFMESSTASEAGGNPWG